MYSSYRSGRATIESCVAHFPNVPDLEKALRAMTSFRQLRRPVLAPADKVAMRQTVLKATASASTGKRCAIRAAPSFDRLVTATAALGLCS